MVQCLKFYSCIRKTEETVSDFVVDLKCLSENCNYSTTLETMLQDRIVCGINDISIQKKLLSKSELTFKKAFEIV